MENLHVLLLEEDHYVMPDTLKVMLKLKEQVTNKFEIMNLGIFYSPSSTQILRKDKQNKVNDKHKRSIFIL